MARNIKHNIAKSIIPTTVGGVSHYGNSLYVSKKTKEAQETLKKFPVPEKLLK